MRSIEQLASLLEDVQRRLANLERPNRLDRSSITIDELGTTMDLKASVLDSPTVPLQAAQGIAAAMSPAAVADFLAVVFFGTDEPVVSPVAGDLWLPKGTVVLQFDGTDWVELVDDGFGLLLSNYRQSLRPSDNRIDTYWVVEPPAAADIGDFWFKTDANNLPYRWDGGQWVPLLNVQSQSTNYAPGETGWVITPGGDSQFQDITALGQVSVPALSVDAINLGGTDVIERLGAFSVGKIISGRLAQQGADLAISTTQTKMFELNCGTVAGGRTYRASVTCQIRNTAAVGTTDRLKFKFVHTTDGSTPILTSPAMDDGFNDNSATPSGNWQSYTFESEVDIATDCPLKIGFCAGLITGSGSYTIYAGSSVVSRPVMSLYDDGPLGARQDAAITVTGGGTSRYVKTFSATWGWGANAADGSILTNSWGSIGGFDDYAAYVGFDSAAMVSALAGAISPVSLVVRWRPRTRVSSGGLDVRFCSHNFSSSAAASGAAGGWPAFAGSNLSTMGLTLLSNIRNNGVPGTSYDDSLGTTVFNQFKAGTRKGLAWLGWPTEASGGEGSVYLDGTNQAQLIFTYDGTS